VSCFALKGLIFDNDRQCPISYILYPICPICVGLEELVREQVGTVDTRENTHSVHCSF
jgi:hypothetical protein